MTKKHADNHSNLLILGLVAGSVAGAAVSSLLKSEESKSTVPVGAIGGALIGAAAIHWLTSGSAKKTEWIETTKSLAESISDRLSHVEEEAHHSDALENIVELASVGIKLWQNIRKS